MAGTTVLTTRWKYCALVSLAMVLLSLIPQIQLWIVRGRDWNGAYVSSQGDELLYSAYINALIDGRKRKNDPFGGRDDSPAAPLPESTLSIQFIPSYSIALVARLFGVSAATAFIALLGMAALFATVSVYWLLESVTAQPAVAAVGTLFVLCLGWIVGRYGIFNTYFDIGIPALHFLRRYQPAAAFPLFFAFQALVWRAFRSETQRVRWLTSAIAGVTLAVLVFSYLYLWTGAAAWLVCVGALWFFLRPLERGKTLKVLATVGITATLALIPYFYLISLRSATLDDQQTMISSHRPDLLRTHELLGGVILLLLTFGVSRGRIRWAQSRVLFAASLAVLPFAVFNQQVLTGKAMQPFHFEIFVVNYSALLGLFLTVTLLWGPLSRRFLILTAALSLLWGFIVVVVPSRLVFLPVAVANDQRIPVLLRLKELSAQDGTVEGLRSRGQAPTLVYSPNLALSRLLPTWTSQGTLLDLGGVDFGNVTREQRKEFFYMHLYYSTVEADALRRALNDAASHPAMDSLARSLIFGHERITPALSSHFKPIEPNEIEREVQIYREYANKFSLEQVAKRQITYAVISVNEKFDFANLDRWYERDAGEQVGDHVLYRLKLRP